MGTIVINSLPFTLQTTTQGPPPAVQVNNTSASYTFTSGDAGTIIPFFSAGAQTATIPVSVFTSSAQLTGIQLGPGVLFITAAPGVVLLPSQTIMAGGQYAFVGALQISANVWVAVGAYFPVAGGVVQFASVGFNASGGQGGP